MCTNGINTGQFEMMIEQTVSKKLHEAQALIDDVRALLDEAKDALEHDAEAAGGVTVELI